MGGGLDLLQMLILRFAMNAMMAMNLKEMNEGVVNKMAVGLVLFLAV